MAAWNATAISQPPARAAASGDCLDRPLTRDGEPASVNERLEADDSDARLLRGMAAGDEDSLSALYRRHGAQLFTFLHRLTGSESAAEEVLQDTLLAVWRGAASFEGRSSVRTWMYVIARRLAYRRLGRRELQLVDLEASPPVVDPGPTPEAIVIAHATRDEIEGLLSELSLIHREALVLFFVDDLSHAEMAQVLGFLSGR